MDIFKEDLENSAEPTLHYETEKPIPSFLHSIAQQRIGTFVAVWYPKSMIFPELTLDTPGEKSVPDLAFYDLESVEIDFNFDETKRKDPPLATVEILSPSRSLQVLVDKTNTYFSFGVRSCSIVIPALQTITVYKAPLRKDETFSGDEVLCDPKLDIRLPLDVIFPPTRLFESEN